MKVKAHTIKKGDMIKIGKRTARVVEAITENVPITRTVKATVLAYSFKDDDDDLAVLHRHLSGDDKIERIPPSVMSIVAGWFKPKLAVKNDLGLSIQYQKAHAARVLSGVTWPGAGGGGGATAASGSR